MSDKPELCMQVHRRTGAVCMKTKVPTHVFHLGEDFHGRPFGWTHTK
jgi:hypothetical protein